MPHPLKLALDAPARLEPADRRQVRALLAAAEPPEQAEAQVLDCLANLGLVHRSSRILVPCWRPPAWFLAAALVLQAWWRAAGLAGPVLVTSSDALIFAASREGLVTERLSSLESR